ncbi:hypothetical protein ES319_A07G180900v1 [Gossypium barbadense]|uniref:BHLH domain-containing protein n=1 Tax=Gossypium barbadense TaxID=3634 RepID=A0A5J5V5A3_GOSBA|nr:hypothetical protein ES319_A07G180900v1 [Gossypium barbadense]
MVKSVASAQLHQEEEDDDGETVKVEGNGSEQKANSNRSKHSETEQRRRSKINERFQTLRDIIPQNDQKRDKASFLLEEKLQIYEGSYQGWSQEATKLIPWRNHCGLAESFIDHSQIMNNGSNCENDGVIPSMVANAQNSIESDLGDAAVFKTPDHPPVPATSMSWQSRDCLSESAVANNSAIAREDLTIRDESVDLSSAYSQGIRNSLTQVLQSSGVDISQASISVKIDVGKRVAAGMTSMPSSSKEKDIQYTSNQEMAQTGVRSYTEESDQAYKRHGTGKS